MTIKISVLTPTIRPDGLRHVEEGLNEQTFPKEEFEWLTSVNTTGVPDFNRAMNDLLRKAKGELIVSLQDYINIEPRGLEMFWTKYQQGHEFMTAPVGKIYEKGVNWDWRRHRTGGKCNWQEWEIDWGAAPKKALMEIGGFDEELDNAWGFDNVNVGLRAELAGYKFSCLYRNVAHAVDHDAFIEHPFRKLRDLSLHNERLMRFRQGLRLKPLV